MEVICTVKIAKLLGIVGQVQRTMDGP